MSNANDTASPADSLEAVGYGLLAILRWEARRMRGEATPDEDAAVAPVIAKLAAVAPTLAREVARYVGAAKAVEERTSRGAAN